MRLSGPNAQCENRRVGLGSVWAALVADPKSPRPVNSHSRLYDRE